MYPSDPSIQIINQHHQATSQSRRAGYLESQTRFDLICQHFGDALVKAENDFHGELWLDVASMHKFIECVD